MTGLAIFLEFRGPCTGQYGLHIAAIATFLGSLNTLSAEIHQGVKEYGQSIAAQSVRDPFTGFRHD